MWYMFKIFKALFEFDFHMSLETQKSFVLLDFLMGLDVNCIWRMRGHKANWKPDIRDFWENPTHLTIS